MKKLVSDKSSSEGNFLAVDGLEPHEIRVLECSMSASQTLQFTLYGGFRTTCDSEF